MTSMTDFLFSPLIIYPVKISNSVRLTKARFLENILLDSFSGCFCKENIISNARDILGFFNLCNNDDLWYFLSQPSILLA